MGNHIFISYAHKDQSFVHHLATQLKSRGAPIWLDQWDIPAGANWNQSIDSALYGCGQFLIVLSPAAVASSQVQGELQMALDEHKPIVPVLHQACQVPRLLRSIQYVDFTGVSPDDTPALERLARERSPVAERAAGKQPVEESVALRHGGQLAPTRPADIMALASSTNEAGPCCPTNEVGYRRSTTTPFGKAYCSA
jgi:hypothetical protein